MESRCRFNLHDSVEEAINDQINLELTASYIYEAMSIYFSHDTRALPGLAKYFKEEANCEHEHASKFIEYLTKRGGKVLLRPIPAPEMDWKSAKSAIEAALDLEKKVYSSLLKIHSIGSEVIDPHISNFIEDYFLEDQVKSLKELADYLTQLERCGCEGLGLYLFDQKFSS